MVQNKVNSFFDYGVLLINLCISFLSYKLKTTAGGFIGISAKLHSCPDVNELLKDKIMSIEFNIGLYSIFIGILSFILSVMILKLSLPKIIKVLNIVIAFIVLFYSIVIF